MKTLALGIIGLALIASVGCVNREAQAQGKRTEAILSDKTPVIQTSSARQMSVSESMEINGQLTTSSDTTIGAKISGRVTSVLVRDGDPVSAGQVIATQDTSTMMAQLRQAQGQVQAAQAQLNQAIANKRINPKRTDAGVRMAEAQLASAKSQLAKARAGARSEERRQAEIAVESAKSQLDLAKKEMERQKSLYEEGATSQQRYEVAQNNYQQALSAYQSSLERLEMTRNMTRPEDLATAQEAVRQAEESLRNAKAQRELDVTLGDQVSAARANLQTAMAGVDLIRTQMADAVVRAPFSGRISGKPVQVGEVLGPGAPVARLIGGDGLYFEGEVSETRITEILPGRPVSVELAAIPGRTFSGTVLALNPLGEQIGRIFRVRIAIDEISESMKPGMFAKGRIDLKTVSDAVVVPKTSIVTEGADRVVYVLDGDKAKRVKVRAGIQNGDNVQVEGLQAGAKVITTGQFGVKDGQAVRDETKAEAATTTSQDKQGE